MVARLLSDTERVVVFDAAFGVTLRLFGYACKQTRTHILTLNHICEVREHLHVVALGQILPINHCKNRSNIVNTFDIHAL